MSTLRGSFAGHAVQVGGDLLRKFLSKPMTIGVHHVGLAVPDLDIAERFFVDTLGWAVVGGVPSYPSVFVSDGVIMVTLWLIPEDRVVSFDRRANVGLHHLALKVADRTALWSIYQRLAADPGVSMEFAPEPIREGSPFDHFICAMPGGVRIEFATAYAGSIHEAER